MRSQAAKLIFAAAALTTLACVTINVYFPEAAVKDLSEKIEDAVAQEAAKEAEGAETPAANGQQGGGSPLIGAVLGALLQLTAEPVHAQEVANPGISNPAIRRIIASRGQRVQELDKLKRAGVVGESNQALVEIRDLGSLALQQRAAAQRLVKDENDDRERMFKEIAAATGADLSQLPQIRSTYAETLRQNARAGDWIQLPNGTWKQK